MEKPSRGHRDNSGQSYSDSDDLSELLGDIRSVSDIDGGLISISEDESEGESIIGIGNQDTSIAEIDILPSGTMVNSSVASKMSRQTTSKDTLEKISAINNLVDWEQLKPQLRSKKTRTKAQNPIVNSFPLGLHARPVRIYAPQLKKIIRTLKRSQKSAKTIQDWDKNMGLKKSHSRTLTKTCVTRKKLIAVMKGMLADSKATIKKKTYPPSA